MTRREFETIERERVTIVRQTDRKTDREREGETIEREREREKKNKDNCSFFSPSRDRFAIFTNCWINFWKKKLNRNFPWVSVRHWKAKCKTTEKQNKITSWTDSIKYDQFCKLYHVMSTV